ncbi:MAG: uracil-DNA glycosylase [Anaerolineae bacterium]|nr:uracil-DNA glycosylase [Candidatus Roseilinea sp.]MDW8449143.1 uracil-DNA glycosylase [Anaerolineae bacterium]
MLQRLKQLHAEIATCRACAEAGFFVEPSPVVVNQPATWPKMMLVGQAPAAAARSRGKPFSGQAGRVLFRWLAQAGFSEDEFRARCYFTAITKCYPGPARGQGDRVPTAYERALCRPFLERELALIRPKLILTVGRISTAHFLGSDIAFTAAIGQAFERDGRIILPLPHPSGVSRWTNDPHNRERLAQALSLLKRYSAQCA